MKLEDFKGDKRTKAYKEFKAKFEAYQAEQSKGLGDDIKNVLDSKPIKPLKDALKSLIWSEGEDCGCDERAEELNKVFPRQKINCLEEEQYNFLVETRDSDIKTFKREGANYIVDIHNHVFNRKDDYTTCGRCLKNMLKKLYKVLDKY